MRLASFVLFSLLFSIAQVERLLAQYQCFELKYA